MVAMQPQSNILEINRQCTWLKRCLPKTLALDNYLNGKCFKKTSFIANVPVELKFPWGIKYVLTESVERTSLETSWTITPNM